MITVFSGTNRPGSLTRVYAEHFLQLFKNELGVEAQIFNLEDFPADAFHAYMYKGEEQSASLVEIQNQYIIGADAFFFVIPEYNGSYPGILKIFIDACSVREYAKSFTGKTTAMFGVSSGRAGNLRGIDHLTGVMHHVGAHVMPKAIPFGQAQQCLNEERKIADADTEKVLLDYAKKFVAYREELTPTNSVG